MTAKASRVRTEWRCPNEHSFAVVALPGKNCPECGAPLSKVTVREQREISWRRGGVSPEALAAALEFERTPNRVRENEVRKWYNAEVERSVVDVLILTALPEELEAVRANSGPWREKHDTGTGLDYFLTTAHHGVSIAATGMTGMGPVNAAVATATALTALWPKHVLLVGFCAGIAPSVRLGDVCVSDQVVDYDLGKIQEGEYAPRWRAYASGTTLVRAAQHFTHSDWFDTIATARPDGSDERPTVHVGTVLSGSKIMADPKQTAALISTWSQAVGLEMEGAGSAAATHAHPSRPSFILIKGVCDRADANKNDNWQLYAADAAARYAISLVIARGDVEGFGVQSRDERNVVLLDPLDDQLAQHPLDDQLAQLGLTRSNLKAALKNSFSLSELRTLCFALGRDWEDISSGEVKAVAVISIIEFFGRRGDLDILVAEIKKERPKLFD